MDYDDFPPEQDDPIMQFMDLSHEPDTQTEIRANGKTWSDCEIIMVDPGLGQVLFENNQCTALVRYDSIQVGPKDSLRPNGMRTKGH